MIVIAILNLRSLLFFVCRSLDDDDDDEEEEEEE
jgi:hypothetical protein